MCLLTVRTKAVVAAVAFAVASVGLLSFSSLARADESSAANAANAAVARSLFHEARKLMADGNYVEACPKLEESQRIDAGKGTAFNLADCYEHTFRIASAWALFLDVAAESRASAQPEHEALARSRADAIEARVPRLIVDVQSPSDGIEVTRDGVPIGKGAWSSPLPLDQGPHRISAHAPGKRPWDTTTELVEGKTATITIPALQDLAVVLPSGDEQKKTTTGALDLRPAVEPPPRSTQRTVAVVLGVVGASALATGAVFGVVSLKARNDASNVCDASNICADQRGVDMRSDALVAGNLSTAFFIGGAVLEVAAITLWLLASPPKRVKNNNAMRIVPTLPFGLGLFSADLR